MSMYVNIYILSSSVMSSDTLAKQGTFLFQEKFFKHIQ